MLRGSEYEGVRFGRCERSGHVESYFIRATDREGRRAIWLKATIFQSAGGAAGFQSARGAGGFQSARGAGGASSGATLAEAWAIAFDKERGHVAVKESVPFAEASFDQQGIGAHVAGCELLSHGSRGSLETGKHTIAWQLTFRSLAPPLVHYPHAFMYEGPFPATKLVSPCPDLRVSGTVEVDGEAWSLDGWPGVLGHNWGRRHAPLYAWGHASAWDEEDEFILEGLSGKVAMGPTLSPMMTLLCLRYRGVRYALNGLTELTRNRGEISPRRWKFEGESGLVTVSGELWGETDDFVGLHYPNPEGSMTQCLNTELAHGRVEITVRGRPMRVLHTRAAALEIGTPDTHHGVRMYV